MTSTSQVFTQAERSAYIGCSELGAIVGLDRYRTPLDVYNDKLGLVPEFQGNNHTLRGQRLEKVAADLYTELTSRKLRRYTRDLVHPEHDFIRGHIDRLVEGEGIVAEIKCPSIAMYRKIQREGLPDGWLLQMQGYIGIGGYKRGVYVIFCADQMDVLHFEVEFDEAIYTTAITAAADFWHKHVIPGVPPIPNANDKPKLELAKQTGTLTRRDDEAFCSAAQLLREANELKRDAEELYETAKSQLLQAIESEYGCYEGGGVRVHFSQQAGRTTFDKKALAAEHPQIDLSRYEKQGQPFSVFKPYFLNQ